MIPSKDTPCQITAMTSVVLMFEMISLIADRLHAQHPVEAAAASG
jgi:hypothetical protein